VTATDATWIDEQLDAAPPPNPERASRLVGLLDLSGRP
jgi:hypothetical protein